MERTEIIRPKFACTVMALLFAAAYLTAGHLPIRKVSAQPPVTLSINRTGFGNGHGIVTSDVAGIDCGPTCSADYNAGETVTLTPSVVTGSLASFAGWSGDCMGTGPCVVMMDAARTVTASFTESHLLEKCAGENPATWPLRFTLGASMTVGTCRAMCQQGGGTGYFAVSRPVGTCVCGTPSKPVSTAPATTGCDQICPTSYPCGGAGNRYSGYKLAGPTASVVTVAGRVTDTTGRAVPQARVALVGQDGVPHQTLTSPFGYFRFNDIRSGQNCVLQVLAKGSEPASQLVDLTENVTSLELVMVPAGYPQLQRFYVVVPKQIP
jgi:hypothetical protein